MIACVVCSERLGTPFVRREAGEFVLCETCWSVWHAGNEIEQQARFEVFRALHALRK